MRERARMYFLMCEEKSKCKNRNSSLCNHCLRNFNIKKDYYEREKEDFKINEDALRSEVKNETYRIYKKSNRML